MLFIALPIQLNMHSSIPKLQHDLKCWRMANLSMKSGSGNDFTGRHFRRELADTVHSPDMHLMLWRSEDIMSWLLTHKVRL